MLSPVYWVVARTEDGKAILTAIVEDRGCAERLAAGWATRLDVATVKCAEIENPNRSNRRSYR